jgi:hypothetical protein
MSSTVASALDAFLRASSRLDPGAMLACFAPDWMLFYRPRGRIHCIAGSGGEAIEAFAAPRDGEPVIRKQTFNGFVNTDLERVLRAARPGPAGRGPGDLGVCPVHRRGRLPQAAGAHRRQRRLRRFHREDCRLSRSGE